MKLNFKDKNTLEMKHALEDAGILFTEKQVEILDAVLTRQLQECADEVRFTMFMDDEDY